MNFYRLVKNSSKKAIYVPINTKRKVQIKIKHYSKISNLLRTQLKNKIAKYESKHSRIQFTMLTN